MSLPAQASRLAQRAVRAVENPIAELPIFLCPRLLRIARPQQVSRRQFHSTSTHATNADPVVEKTQPPPKTAPANSLLLLKKLPTQCPGCGALSQIWQENDPGYYDLKQRSVKEYIGEKMIVQNKENEAYELAIKKATDKDPGFVEKLGLDVMEPAPTKPTEVPFCRRCHDLRHHEKGVSIFHPSISSIRDTLFESPFKYNHVYHIIDAADFPMSLIPGLHKILNITPQRSLNRRSKTGKFYHGTKTDVSFIITRSDLLAPTKEQVDSLMPWLREVLREALGRAAEDARLGNIRCVSARRSWWTKELKEDIWNRGGGGWMVGKVNVGKSQLFHDVFPKGRRGTSAQEKLLKPLESAEEQTLAERAFAELVDAKPSGSNENYTPLPISEQGAQIQSPILEPLEALDPYSLLPPAPPEEDYPTMPLVSSLPGTTASPIRISYGNGKGELIDLPGLARGDLELHVQPEHRSSLLMRTRVKPQKYIIKPGQSLLLGGFIRITPLDPNVIFAAYSFHELDCHVTSTEKAISIQKHAGEIAVRNISLPETSEKIKSAGIFDLRWDVTKPHTGPLTAREAGRVSVDRLPFRVMSADLLIESCGWVELVAQIRKRPGELTQRYENKIEAETSKQDASSPDSANDSQTTSNYSPIRDDGESPAQAKERQWPAVEVFTPEGKFVATRRPLNGWVIATGNKTKKHHRPRRAMSGVKKQLKQRSREMAIAR